MNRDFVTSWNDMKWHMRERFVGHDYEQDILKKYYNLQKGRKSMEEYYEKIEHNRLQGNISNEKVKLVARFISGLNNKARQPLKLHSLSTL